MTRGGPFSRDFLHNSSRVIHYDDVELRATGRYAHSRDYVENLANQAGLTLVDYAEQPLRKEQQEWLMGGFYLLRRGG